MSTLAEVAIPIAEERIGSLPSFQALGLTAVDLNRFRIVNRMPRVIRALFSST